MKSIIKMTKFSVILVFTACTLVLSSCEKYLDKSPDAGMPETELFKNFKNFQGYIELLYSHLVSPWNGNSCGIVSDEAYMVTATDAPIAHFHNGNYQHALGDVGRNMFGRSNANWSILNRYNDTNAAAEARGAWYSSWFGIYLANKGLANMDKMYGTEDEKKVIRGQLLFFRAYFHFNIMQYWGGIPLIDQFYEASEDIVYLPRMKFQEVTEALEADLLEAADLLPLDWDEESYGDYTITNNTQRLTKFSALSVLGKYQLYAASPLMNYEAKGVKAFDEELCKKAAATLKRLIDLCNSTNKRGLQRWDKMDRIFFTYDRTLPDIWEALLVPVPANTPMIQLRGLMYCLFSPVNNLNIYGCQYHLNLNYEFQKNFGMANGLPITESDSGFDPADPWSNRDPRFDSWICKDGDQITQTTPSAAGSVPEDQFAQFYTGGRHRGTANNAVYTGMGTKKFWDLFCNPQDTPATHNTNQYLLNPPLIRLADVYLMYAEAVLWGYGSPTSTIPGDASPLTPVGAVNTVRARAGSADGGTQNGMPPLDARYHGDRNKFFELLIQERAMELLFESQRFNDLRRWMCNTDPKYTKITGIDFERDPVTSKPVNLTEWLVKNIPLDDRHYWLPFPTTLVSLYDGFYQNPGW